MNTNLLNILPGIQEQQAFGKFDNENKDSRPFRCKDGTIDFNRPMNSKRERLCEPGKSVPDKDIELCTYGGKLNFFGKNTSTCSSVRSSCTQVLRLSTCTYLNTRVLIL